MTMLAAIIPEAWQSGVAVGLVFGFIKGYGVVQSRRKNGKNGEAGNGRALGCTPEMIQDHVSQLSALKVRAEAAAHNQGIVWRKIDEVKDAITCVDRKVAQLIALVEQKVR
jgi:hypothetical protein